MRKPKVNFPKYLFITQDEFSDKSGKYLSVHEDQLEAVKDTDRIGKSVATYQLVKVHELELSESVKGLK